MALISVIIPAYNAEKTVAKTIGSVLNQTINDLELIVIDDGSKDKTLEIASAIKDPRIKVFSYPNSGVAVSRNRGISLATGEYISFIDADDLWTPDKLEAQLKALQENTQAAVAYSWTNMIDQEDNFVSKGRHKNISGDVYSYLLLTNFLESGSNPLIRTQALKEVGNFDESLKHSQDWDMYLRLAARYHFAVVCQPQILYRKSDNSMSSNLLGLEEAGRKVSEKAFAQAPQSLQYLKAIVFKNRYKYYTFKALEGFPIRQRGLIALLFLWYAIKYDPALLLTKVIWKILLKITVVVVLSPQLSKALLKKFPNIFNIDPLILYIKKELPTELQ